VNIKCAQCHTKKHGAVVEDNFACFKCMTATAWDGSTYGISRAANELHWSVEVGVREPHGGFTTQWVPVSDDYETAYTAYVNKLIVT